MCTFYERKCGASVTHVTFPEMFFVSVVKEAEFREMAPISLSPREAKIMHHKQQVKLFLVSSIANQPPPQSVPQQERVRRLI